MTWTYTGDPAGTARDSIRFLVGDTDEADQLLTDEEIAWVLSETSSETYKAAAQCARAIAAKWTRLADQSVGDLQVSMSQKAAAALTLASELDDMNAADAGTPIPYAGGISVADKEARAGDAAKVGGKFVSGQFDNVVVVDEEES